MSTNNQTSAVPTTKNDDDIQNYFSEMTARNKEWLETTKNNCWFSGKLHVIQNQPVNSSSSSSISTTSSSSSSSSSSPAKHSQLSSSSDPTPPPNNSLPHQGAIPGGAVWKVNESYKQRKTELIDAIGKCIKSYNGVMTVDEINIFIRKTLMNLYGVDVHWHKYIPELFITVPLARTNNVSANKVLNQANGVIFKTASNVPVCSSYNFIKIANLKQLYTDHQEYTKG
jgi:hypothetical protein